tara:strand:- start:51 stop:494 length:444 start_codon:yes stop_codon:yes gene_type:complete
MSDYTLAVGWSGKDALADSDAAKVISGADFNTEFTTVRTAVNSKADINGDASESFAIDDATIAGLATIGETLGVTGNTTLSTLTVSGIPTIPTAATATSTTQAASTAHVHAAIDADVTTHAALRSSSTVFGHAKIWTSGGDLYIATA